MSRERDRRVTPWRADLAAAHLQGELAAGRYVEGAPHTVAASLAPVLARPANAAPRLTEALYGETITVFEEESGWAWGQLASDGYVGYVRAGLLSVGDPAATHRVAALRTFRYRDPDIKSEVLGWASLNAPLAVAALEGEFARLAGGAYVSARHIRPLGQWERDFVSVAERLAGTPYLWGGRTSLGLDCSALVQQSLAAAGIACPRDSDMIERAVGAEVALAALDGGLRRGDLIFWAGHCAIMVSAGGLVHANAHHMATVIEPLAAAVRRIAGGAGPVTGLRRLA